MSELIQAIFGLYAGTSSAAIALRAVTPGGMWLSQAPQKAAGVYIVITPVVAPVSYAQGTSSAKVWTQDCDIQFTLATLSGTAADIVAATTAFQTLFDFAALTMSGQTLLVARRLNNQGPLRDDLTRGYMGYIEYRFMIGG